MIAMTKARRILFVFLAVMALHLLGMAVVNVTHSIKERTTSNCDCDKHQENGPIQKFKAATVPHNAGHGSNWTPWKQHVREMCQKLGMATQLTSNDLDSLELVLMDPRHKILYCPIPKVASMYLINIFTILNGLYNGTDPTKINRGDADKKYRPMIPHLTSLPFDEVVERIGSYYSFVFVREPFERLLSAYRNKLFVENPSFINFNKRLVMHYRTDHSIQGLVTFPEFVSYLVDPNPKVPTNVHWIPFHKLCQPCLMNYDFVGRLETMGRDIPYILDSHKLTNLVQVPRSEEETQSLGKTDEHMKTFYSQVPRSHVRKLYDMYYADFALFNISVPEIIKNMME